MSAARPLPPIPAGFPDRRNAEQMRAHDSIEEKRWRARVAANEARRRSRTRDRYDDDKDSALRDEWRAEEREWMNDFREMCR